MSQIGRARSDAAVEPIRADEALIDQRVREAVVRQQIDGVAVVGPHAIASRSSGRRSSAAYLPVAAAAQTGSACVGLSVARSAGGAAIEHAAEVRQLAGGDALRG